MPASSRRAFSVVARRVACCRRVVAWMAVAWTEALESERRLWREEMAADKSRLRELEAGQRVALHAHATHVWGSRWQQCPDEPTVFNLTGKSASEVAAVRRGV